MKKFILNPNEFMREAINSRYSLKIPIIILTINAIIGCFQVIYRITWVQQIFPPDVVASATYMTFFGIQTVTALIIPFLAWIFYSGIFFTISHFSGGDGDFRRVIQLSSYGYIPTIFDNTSATVVNIIALRNTPPIGIDISLWYSAVLSEHISLLMGQSIISLLFLLWSANIWVFAVKHARNLTTRNAVITVAIPVGAMIGYQIYQLLGMI